MANLNQRPTGGGTALVVGHQEATGMQGYMMISIIVNHECQLEQNYHPQHHQCNF